jgi:hypothetical protein
VPPPGEGEAPASGPDWPTGPRAPWPTAVRAQRPEGPAEQRQGQPRDQEPAREQWSAQLRKQAPSDAELTAPPADADERWAMISYLGVPFLGFLPPLAVYLIKLRTSRFARHHATQALNLSITVILYNICALILAGLLALDSVDAALALMVPLLAGLWIVTLAYLVLAGTAASRGGYYKIPSWLCATLVH